MINHRYTIPRREGIGAYFSPFGALLAFIGGALVLIGTSRYGIGISPDSVNYVYCARHLAMGEGFRTLDNGHFTQWPPLYPLILSTTGFLGIDPLSGARWVNALLFIVLIFSTYHLFRQHIKQNALVVAGTFSAVFCIQVVYFTLMAWSETLFALTVVLYCIQLNTTVRMPTKRSFIWAILWAALASLTRYIGVTLIAAGVASILVFQARPVKQRLKQATVLAVASALPLAIWMLRNLWLGDGFAGQRMAATVSLPDSILSTLRAFSLWFLPPTVPFGWRLTLIAIVVGGLSWIAFARRRDRTSVGSSAPSLAVLMTVFGLYIAAIAVISTITSVDRLPIRYLSVVYIPGICILFSMFSRLEHHGKKVRKIGRWVSICLYAMWLLNLSGNLYLLMHNAMGNGAGGYARKEWQHSATIEYLKNNPLRGLIYTNGADAVYILNGQTAMYLPRADRLKQTWCVDHSDDKPQYVVWFNKIYWRSHMAARDPKDPNYTLLPYRRFSDGAIYLVQCKAIQ